MKMSKKILAFILAASFVFSAFCLSVFADDAIESPIIPVGPQSTPWYEYEFVDDNTALILCGFNYNSTRTNVTVRASAEKDGNTYPVIGVAPEVFKETGIKSVTIEEGVRRIDKDAFLNCEKLTTVEFASSVTFIDETAFDGTAWLANQPDGVVYAGKIAYKAKGTCPASVSLAADTVSIANGAFRGQTTLEKVFVPAATTVGEEAFAGCTAVKIYCYENSPAHTYAVENSIDFVIIPSLVLNTPPTKLEYYQNDPLNFAGMDLIYISEAGETPVVVEESMVSGYDAATLGDQTVTITYEGKSVSFQVNVVERPAFIPGDVDGNGVKEINDAIHLLFHKNFEDAYPVNQPVDFDGNGSFEIDDAIYLLFHINFEDVYPLH
ncbi:MAG: hypothetical protein E7580_03705 [Ruminococcaceae bacterium]|nr:hypothetical protein [Oscillospiraceae bacterium]